MLATIKVERAAGGMTSRNIGDSYIAGLAMERDEKVSLCLRLNKR